MQQDAMNSTMTMNQISSTSQIRTSVADIFNPPPYSSIFFHSTPSPTPFAAHPVTSDEKCTRNTASATAAAAKSLSRMMSEHKELLSRHAFCLTHLRKTFKEAETLRQENTNLRLANVELSKHVNFLIQITSQSQYQTQPFTENFGGDFEMEKDSEGWDEGFSAKNQSPTSEIEKDEEENQKDDAARVTLPKSISVRSNGFLKMSQTGGGPSGSNSGALRAATRIRPPNPVTGPHKVYVRGGSKKVGPIELEVYNQGMYKTELCNKWQETGSCLYGDHCQFAHGIDQLRPVIRHPRYKTEVCRMVLAGEPCPYGHRCHFRHALTDEEKLMLPLRLD
ncbi:hypothetical protein BVRB_6g143120 [Beta vulgaris subsp. vulgaris]|nr:hypothetical protein BVRB_6g143120 [Beta vulgaris subsp. vulgaris]